MVVRCFYRVGAGAGAASGAPGRRRYTYVPSPAVYEGTATRAESRPGQPLCEDHTAMSLTRNTASMTDVSDKWSSIRSGGCPWPFSRRSAVPVQSGHGRRVSCEREPRHPARSGGERHRKTAVSSPGDAPHRQDWSPGAGTDPPALRLIGFGRSVIPRWCGGNALMLVTRIAVKCTPRDH